MGLLTPQLWIEKTELCPTGNVGSFRQCPGCLCIGSYVCVVGWGVGVVPGAQSVLSPISRLKGRHFPLLAAESPKAQREPEEAPCFCLLYGEVGLLSSLWLGKEWGSPTLPSRVWAPLSQTSCLSPSRSEGSAEGAALETAVLPVFN